MGKLDSDMVYVVGMFFFTNQIVKHWDLTIIGYTPAEIAMFRRDMLITVTE